MAAIPKAANNPVPPASIDALFGCLLDLIDNLTFLLPAWTDELTASSTHSSLFMKTLSPSSSTYLNTAVEGSKLGIFPSNALLMESTVGPAPMT